MSSGKQILDRLKEKKQQHKILEILISLGPLALHELQSFMGKVGGEMPGVEGRLQRRLILECTCQGQEVTCSNLYANFDHANSFLRDFARSVTGAWNG